MQQTAGKAEMLEAHTAIETRSVDEGVMQRLERRIGILFGIKTAIRAGEFIAGLHHH